MTPGADACTHGVFSNAELQLYTRLSLQLSMSLWLSALCVQLEKGQYQVGYKPASGGGDWSLYQAPDAKSPVVVCPGLTAGTRYTFRSRTGDEPSTPPACGLCSS